MSKQYDELRSNPMDAKQHPDTIIPDPSSLYMTQPMPIQAGQYLNATPKIGTNY